jgi:hypothetical protein
MTMVPLEASPSAEGIVVTSGMRDELQGLLAEVRASTATGEPIFVYPTSPFIYVLANRPNPVRYDHFYPGTVSRTELEGVVQAVENAGVRTVVVSTYTLLDGQPVGDNALIEEYLATCFAQSNQFGAYRVLRRILNLQSPGAESSTSLSQLESPSCRALESRPPSDG